MKNLIYSFFTAVALMLAGCKDPVINLTDVEISPTNMTFEVDESRTLSVVITLSDADNRAVSWDSDKPSVATVSDSGEVTAILDGSATITATTDDGGQTTTGKVTVVTVTTSGTIGNLAWELTDNGTLTISGEGAMPV